VGLAALETTTFGFTEAGLATFIMAISSLVVSISGLVKAFNNQKKPDPSDLGGSPVVTDETEA
jgi:hypothetical protein